MAQIACRFLPPLIAQRVRNGIYPRDIAYRDSYQFTVRATTGSVFRYTTNNYSSYPLAVHGYFTWRAWAIAIAVCQQGDTIVEVGANIGTETIGFADIVGPSGSVFAFEPLPANLEILRNNVVRNRATQVQVLPFAVSDREGKVSFSVPRDAGTSPVGSLFLSEKYHGFKTIEVNCVYLDALATRIGDLRLLFIDAEGAELNIVLGAQETLARHKPFLVLESSSRLLNNFGYTREDLLQVLHELDYRAFEIGKLGLKHIAQSESPQHSNWFCLHRDNSRYRSAVERSLVRCGTMPMIKGLNPLLM